MELLKSPSQNQDLARATLTELPVYLQQSARYILKAQKPEGAITWFEGGKLDPWDHIEAAMGLSVAGYWQQAEAAYHWLRQQQGEDGSWLSNYYCEADDFTALKQTHFIAYIACGVWHHYKISGNRAFLTAMLPCVSKAIDCVLNHQSTEGDIAWAFSAQAQSCDDALLTGCSSILRSLECAINIALCTGHKPAQWILAAQRLAQAIRCKPERFDRNCQSKKRFAMDWYYPILSGALSQAEGTRHLDARWKEFIEVGLGCRCVNDEPWVTVAETSELVIALTACGRKPAAMELFYGIHQQRDRNDGAYWTGYVTRDNSIWPEEKTTWTAAAVLLAADALFKYSKAHDLFTRPLRI